MREISNEQKAKDITKCLWFPQKCTEDDIQNMLMQMAEWKDKQFAVLLRTELATWQGDSAEAKYRREMLKELLNQFK